MAEVELQHTGHICRAAGGADGARLVLAGHDARLRQPALGGRLGHDGLPVPDKLGALGVLVGLESQPGQLEQHKRPASRWSA